MVYFIRELLWVDIINYNVTLFATVDCVAYVICCVVYVTLFATQVLGVTFFATVVTLFTTARVRCYSFVNTRSEW